MDLPQVLSQPQKKRRRGSNWSLNETLLLIELYKERAHIIRKRPHHVGFYKPAIIKAWEEIASLLGQHPSQFKRSVKECRKRWCTVQTTAKTNLHKAQQGLTLGDGSSPQPLHVVDRKVLDIIEKNDVNVMDFEKVIEITLPNKKEAAECGTVRNAAASTTLPAAETAAHHAHADTYSAVVEKNKEDVDDQEHQELDFELKLLDSQLKKKELELKKKEIELKQKEIELKIEKIKFYQLQNKKLEQSMTCIETPAVFNKK